MANSTIPKNIILQNIAITNVTCSANSVVNVDYTIPAKAGYSVALISVWADNTDTTSPANTSQVFAYNHWSDMGSASSAKTAHVAFRNIASGSAKFTANMRVMYYK